MILFFFHFRLHLPLNFFISGAFGKNLYVTQDDHGRDQNDCGPELSPCKTIEHAINISTPFDTILIDGGKKDPYEYVLSEMVLIEKELTLTSIKFQHIPKITMKINSHRQSPLAFFNITKNFTLSAVDVHVDNNGFFSPGIHLLTIQTNKTSVTLSDSYLRYIHPLFDLLADAEIPGNWKIALLKTLLGTLEIQYHFIQLKKIQMLIRSVIKMSLLKSTSAIL